LSPARLRRHGEFGKLARHMRFVEQETRHLGRALFHAMVRFGPKLEKKQMVLFRAVDIGAELFAMSAACVRATMLAKQGRPEAATLADAFCLESRERVKAGFAQLTSRHDPALYRVAMQVLKGEHAWLEQGIVSYESLYLKKKAAPPSRGSAAEKTAKEPVAAGV
jgi:hypothetical protein